MATKTHNHSRCPRRPRVRRVARAVAGHWLLALVAHSSAILLLLLVEQLVRVGACGGR